MKEKFKLWFLTSTVSESRELSNQESIFQFSELNPEF